MAYCSAMCELRAEGYTIDDLLRIERASAAEREQRRVARDVDGSVAVGSALAELASGYTE